MVFLKQTDPAAWALSGVGVLAYWRVGFSLLVGLFALFSGAIT